MSDDFDWNDAGDAGKGCGFVGFLIFGGVGILFFILKMLGVINI